MTEDAGSHATGPASGANLRVWHVAVGAAAIVIGFAVWLVLRDGSSPSSTSPVPKGSKALPISVKGMKTLAARGIPISWAGESARS